MAAANGREQQRCSGSEGGEQQPRDEGAVRLSLVGSSYCELRTPNSLTGASAAAAGLGFACRATLGGGRGARWHWVLFSSVLRLVCLAIVVS